ncbi:hypothetical protein RDI58_024396 [Solanum bulbocastanum]|uniref:Uncharacterized protein n=1 Tax=Solanum bulbocastanum TaxID=147425 RepID=A0AAN8SXH1_SOLBU
MLGYMLSSVGILQCVSNKRLEFFKLNPNGQVPLLDTLDNHVCENIAIVCCITLWHHQSILTYLQVESHNTLTYLAKNVSHYMHRNGSNVYDILIDLNLENFGDTTLYHMCSTLDALISGNKFAPASPLLLLNNNQCISLVRAICFFFF